MGADEEGVAIRRRPKASGRRGAAVSPQALLEKQYPWRRKKHALSLYISLPLSGSNVSTMYTMFTFESVERQTVCVHIKLDSTDPH